jgi:AcrR family transcriptional regulator
MRGRRTKRTSGEDRERDILATAERLLAERPLSDISIDDLARGAGLSRPTFYFYFESKEAVILALLDRVAEEARIVREAALAPATAVPEIWKLGVGSILDTFTEHRSLALAVTQMAPGSEAIRQLWGRILEAFIEDTALGIASEEVRGRALPGIDPRSLAVVLVLLTERTFVSSVAEMEPNLPADEALDVVLRIWSRAIYGDDSLGA